MSLEAKGMKGPLLERVDLEARNPKRLADASSHDCWKHLGVGQFCRRTLFG